MRLILAGPSVVRQFPASTSATAGARRLTRHAALSTFAPVRRPVASASAHASLGQIPSDVSPAEIRASAVHAKLDSQNAVAPMFRRQRREIEKKARKERAAAKKKANSPLAMAGLEEKRVSPYVRKDHQFKTFKPITHSLRWLRYSIQPHLHKGGPLRILTTAKRSTGGRNHHGHVTVRGRGGGHKRRLRLVDFHRWETGTQTVLRIEYDPGRSAHIALIEHDVTKIKSYILACEGLREGDSVQSYRLDKEAIAQASSVSALDMGMFRTRAIRPGNVLPLRLIPIGTTVHALSLDVRGKAKLVRSAGSYGQLVAFVNKKSDNSKIIGDSTATKGEAASAPSSGAVLPGLSATGKEEAASRTSFQSRSDANSNQAQTGGAMSMYAQVKLQSGEVRLLRSDCCATIGRVSNVDHRHETLGKAGRSRWLGRRPKVRGVAMNAVDHPHGGGRGKSKSNKHPRSIYGWKTKGPRTRKPGTRNGNKMVVRERPRGVEKRSA